MMKTRNLLITLSVRIKLTNGFLTIFNDLFLLIFSKNFFYITACYFMIKNIKNLNKNNLIFFFK